MFINLIPSTDLPISQSLAFNFAKAKDCALAIGQKTSVMAMVKLSKIKRQMLFTDMVERANHAALEQAEKPFNTIGCDKAIAFHAGIFFDGVIHHEVLAIADRLAIAKKLIRVYHCPIVHMLFDNLFKILASDMLQHLTANRSTALQDRNDRHAVTKLSLTNTFALSANVGFINLYSAAKFVVKRRVLQGETNAMRHKQRRAVASQFKQALQMEAAAHRIALLLEDGYGGNGLKLIELLEKQESK